jgi:3-hydroxyisobutyrate dehydrogenase-like beta-hydroxyacid dehydrogenase
MKVGFIGLGLMGNPMAKNILKAGIPLTVYNRTASKVSEFKSLGARIAGSPQELAGSSDIVITMVTGPNDVKEVLFGAHGVIEGRHKGLTVIDMSTIGTMAALEIVGRLNTVGIQFLDAPVTGSTPKAKSGELTIFIGGKKDVYEKVKPVLMAMGNNLHYVGKSGSGQAIKLINNYILAATIAVLSEGMIFADSIGLPPKVVEEILKTVPAMSPMMNLKIPNYVTQTYPLLFSMKNMRKDLSLAHEELKKHTVDLPIFQKTRAVYELACKRGFVDADFSQVIKVIGKHPKS